MYSWTLIICCVLPILKSFGDFDFILRSPQIWKGETEHCFSSVSSYFDEFKLCLIVTLIDYIRCFHRVHQLTGEELTRFLVMITPEVAFGYTLFVHGLSHQIELDPVILPLLMLVSFQGHCSASKIKPEDMVFLTELDHPTVLHANNVQKC